MLKRGTRKGPLFVVSLFNTMDYKHVETYKFYNPTELFRLPGYFFTDKTCVPTDFFKYITSFCLAHL